MTQAAEEIETLGLRYAGTALQIEVEAAGARIFSQASPPAARGVPNVTVFVLASGVVGVATEKAATPAMRAAVDALAAELGAELAEREVDGDSCRELHRALVERLRREWCIGRVVRRVDLAWDYVV